MKQSVADPGGGQGGPWPPPNSPPKFFLMWPFNNVVGNLTNFSARFARNYSINKQCSSNLPGYDLFLFILATKLTFLPLKARQLKVVMVLIYGLQHPYEHLRFKQNIRGTNARQGKGVKCETGHNCTM